MILRPIMLIAIICAIVVSCQGCSGTDIKSPTQMVDEMAENCRRGMGEASVHKEESELDVNVKCAR